MATLLAALGLFLAAELVLWASLGQLQATSTEGDGLFFVVMLTAFAAAAAIAGTVIVMRQPGNMIGWLLLAIPLCAAFALMAGDYATYTLVTAPGSLPFGQPPHGSTGGQSCRRCAFRSCCSCCFPTAVFPLAAGGRRCGSRSPRLRSPQSFSQ